MAGETNLKQLIKGMAPHLNVGEYVFVTVKNIQEIDRNDTLCEFKEKEGVTIIMEKYKADELSLTYDYIASWITLLVHSSLESVGMTALVSNELAKHNISCNIFAGFYHDHVFVPKEDSERAINVLTILTKSYK